MARDCGEEPGIIAMTLACAFPRVSNLSKQLDKPYCKNLFCKNSTAALEALAFAQLRVLTPPTPIFVISARSDLNASGVAFATLLRSRSWPLALSGCV